LVGTHFGQISFKVLDHTSAMVAGVSHIEKQAEIGLKLFNEEAKIEFDTDGAQAFKDSHEAAIKAKEAEAEALTGKDNKKARTEKSKEASAMKADAKYVDACKVVKGLEAPSGNFMTKGDAGKPAAAGAGMKEVQEDQKAGKKDDKPKKKTESAGLSPDEKKELDKLKVDIIARKTELKAAGKSGGECNKDEQVVGMVARMTELKIKEDPTLADGDKKKGDDKKKDKSNKTEESMTLAKKIEDYRGQLKSEFGYTDKDIKADPDMLDMTERLRKMK